MSCVYSVETNTHKIHFAIYDKDIYVGPICMDCDLVIRKCIDNIMNTFINSFLYQTLCKSKYARVLISRDRIPQNSDLLFVCLATS